MEEQLRVVAVADGQAGHCSDALGGSEKHPEDEEPRQSGVSAGPRRIGSRATIASTQSARHIRPARSIHRKPQLRRRRQDRPDGEERVQHHRGAPILVARRHHRAPKTRRRRSRALARRAFRRDRAELSRGALKEDVFGGGSLGSGSAVRGAFEDPYRLRRSAIRWIETEFLSHPLRGARADRGCRLPLAQEVYDPLRQKTSAARKHEKTARAVATTSEQPGILVVTIGRPASAASRSARGTPSRTRSGRRTHRQGREERDVRAVGSVRSHRPSGDRAPIGDRQRTLALARPDEQEAHAGSGLTDQSGRLEQGRYALLPRQARDA